ncbi:MAG: hypothetical protein ACI4U3_09255 [Traorella sp.]
MESYIEITFLHNLLIHALSLTLSIIYSRKCMSKHRFFLIIGLLTSIQSFFFFDKMIYIIWLNEMIIFLFLFNYYISTYLLFIGWRFVFHGFYYLFFSGTIYHHQFFIFDEKVLLFDLIVLILYISLLLKAKYHLSEYDFIYQFVLNHKKYQGYVDSGNLATYQNIPIIFIKDHIYQDLTNKKETLLIETIQNQNIIECKKAEIKIHHQKKIVYCSPISNDYDYDALLNMKGLL